MTPVPQGLSPREVLGHLFAVLIVLLCISNNAVAQMCDPSPSLECEDAPVFCTLSSLDGFSCSNPSQANASGPSPLCPQGGVPNNLSWWAFVSGGGQIELEITTGSCSGSQTPGIQVGIYTDCKFTQPIACEAECFTGTTILSAQTDACQVYYAFIDGCNGASCEYTIRVITGMDPSQDPSAPEMELVESACLGSEVCARIIDYQGCKSSFVWSVNGVELSETGPEYCQVYSTPGLYTLCVQSILGSDDDPCERSQASCKQLLIPEIPIVTAPEEKVCYEDRFGLFFIECATPVPPVPGKYNICCNVVVSPEGCLNRLCKEYEIFSAPTSDRIVNYYCEKAVVELPDGRLTEECGAFNIPVRGGNVNGCDSNFIFEVIFLDPVVEFEIPDCGMDDYCVQADLTIPCLENVPPFDIYWTSSDGKDTLAAGTNRFCAPERGLYCVVLDLKLNDQQCISHRECIEIPSLSMLQRRGKELICSREYLVDTFSFVGRQEPDAYEWYAVGAEILKVLDDTIIHWQPLHGQQEVQLCVEGSKNECQVLDTCFTSRVKLPPSADLSWEQDGNALVIFSGDLAIGRSTWIVNAKEYEGDTIKVPFSKDQLVNVFHYRSNDCDTAFQRAWIPFRKSRSITNPLEEGLDGLPVHSNYGEADRSELQIDQSSSLSIFDLSGKLVFDHSQFAYPTEWVDGYFMNKGGLPNGVYILLITNHRTGYRSLRKLAIFR